MRYDPITDRFYGGDTPMPPSPGNGANIEAEEGEL